VGATAERHLDPEKLFERHSYCCALTSPSARSVPFHTETSPPLLFEAKK
jgi:hypothetical protein